MRRIVLRLPRSLMAKYQLTPATARAIATLVTITPQIARTQWVGAYYGSVAGVRDQNAFPGPAAWWAAQLPSATTGHDLGGTDDEMAAQTALVKAIGERYWQQFDSVDGCEDVASRLRRWADEREP